MGEIDVIAAVREAADECLKSSVANGEYSTAFYVSHIVLTDLANRLERRAEAALATS